MLLNILLPVALCISASLESLAIHFITSIQTIKGNPEQLIIITEFLKIVLSSLFFYLETHFQTYSLWDNQLEVTIPYKSFNLNNIHWFFVPAFIYTICNNLIYFALESITPSTFNLLTNFKIPITILLAFFTFSGQYKFNMYQLLVIMLVFSGNILAVYNPNGVSFINYTGIFIMLFYSLCSGIASVYCEFVMKCKFKNENVFLQNIKFSLCSILCNFVITVIYGNILHWRIEPVHMLSIVSMAIYGILTGIVLKYNGSVVKTYSTSFSVFISMIFSYFLWGYQISTYFVLGSTLSIAGISIYLYDKQINKNVESNPYTIIEQEPDLIWE